MANFLIQTIDGQIKHDFCFGLVEAIEYQNWLNKGTHDYHLTDIENMFEYDMTGSVPCGTIQFIQKFLEFYHDKNIVKPINIPQQLLKNEYTKRNVNYIHTLGTHTFDKPLFIKTHHRIKGLTEIKSRIEVYDEEVYLVSDTLDIESEWRAFVYNNKLVGMQNYLGDFTMFPDVELIQKMIDEYTECPPAYTLDVGINSQDSTFIIEVHNMWSVGLYGFSDYRILPQMFIRSFRHLVQKGW